MEKAIRLCRQALLPAVLCTHLPFSATALEYQLPSPAIEAALKRQFDYDINLNFPERFSLSPDRSKMILRHQPAYPPLSDLAEPSLRVASMDIRLNTRRPVMYDHASTRLELLSTADGKLMPVDLPAGSRMDYEAWSPDGNTFACLVYRGKPGEVWLVDAATGRARALTGPIVNSVSGNRLQWLDQGRLLVTLVAENLRLPDAAAIVAQPIVRESRRGEGGKAAGSASVQSGPADIYSLQRIAYYVTSELGVVGLDGSVSRLGVIGMNLNPLASPDGKFILCYSSLHPQHIYHSEHIFPHRFDLYDAHGKRIANLVEKIAAGGGGYLNAAEAPAEPRAQSWQLHRPATLWWLQANGAKDDLLEWSAPFTAPPKVILRSDRRIVSAFWGREDWALTQELDATTNVTGLYCFYPRKPDSAPKKLLENLTPPYKPPRLQWAPLSVAVGIHSIRNYGLALPFRKGLLYVMNGGRTEVRLLDVVSGRLSPYLVPISVGEEQFVAFVGHSQRQALTLRSPPAQGPNLYLRDIGAEAGTRVTQFVRQPVLDPQQLRVEEQEAVRADGLPLHAQVILPADWKAGQPPLPALFWVYAVPYATREEYNGSLERMRRNPRSVDSTFVGLPFLALTGYATVIYNVPIVGESGRRPYDNYVDQLKASTAAMVEALGGKGLVDMKRLAVAGHSGGGTTTANLLEHTRYFRAGIASNGPYNRTLNPFGGTLFEERTLWEEPRNYTQISPLFAADKIEAPLLILRGHAEEHPAIHPAESMLFYSAVSSLGKETRFVELPYEGHIYLARESILHIYWEVQRWLEKYVN